ncbi:MAG: response regulator [Deltaproteobacteria bacterium]|nr:response regulator [Deltaproteobacteria bacterium]
MEQVREISSFPASVPCARTPRRRTMAAKRILVFESDTAFAAELTRDFAHYGGVVEVVDDGNVGLERARVERPELILLCIELPRMNGFSICNKLKKNPELKDIPLIIMSSEASEETFEQHRKLRTRAEDYLRKPFTFETLLEKVSLFVQLEPGAVAAPEDPVVFDEEIALEEAIQFDDETMIASPAAAKALVGTDPEVRVDDDVEAFAEEAFGNLMMADGDRTVTERHSGRRKASPDVAIPEPVPVAPPAIDAAPVEPPRSNGADSEALAAAAAEIRQVSQLNEELEGQAQRLSQEVERLAAELAAAKSETTAAKSEAATARSEVAAARSEAAAAKSEAAPAKSEGAPAKSEPRGTRGGVSSREFLDLRETINKKDKEILDLRDSINSRDKQIVDVRDKVNALEREKADLEDRLIDLEKSLAERQEEIAALAVDKEAAAKRGDDLKHRLERAQGEIEKAYRDIDDAKKRREELLAAKDHEIEELRAQHRTAQEKLAAERDEQQTRAVGAAETALRQEMADALAKQKGEADALAGSVKEAHDKAVEDAEERRQTELFEAEEKRKTDLRLADDQRKEELRQAEARHEAATQQAAEAAQAQRERELNTQIERHGREMAVLGGKLAESEDKLGYRIQELADLQAEKDKAQARDAEKIAALTKRGDDLEGERDGLRVELSSARAEIEVLHDKIKELSEKLSEVEGKNATNEERALRALAKVRADEQTVDKAKRAMAIALSLLDDQIQPRLEDQ